MWFRGWRARPQVQAIQHSYVHICIMESRLIKYLPALEKYLPQQYEGTSLRSKQVSHHLKNAI
jgi:hypothetical protein